MVAFSAENVYAIAELIRRQRGGAAVVMGSLSPRTRNAQVALYQSGEVDFLVATDAIGMGLNMDVDHVAFAGLRKFDGKRTRWLHPQEVGQIAGRAGRYRTDGTFGVTGDAPEMDEDLVGAVEEHRFEPVTAAEWRNTTLDFTSLKGLLRTLAAPPGRDGLKLAEESLDETTLRQLSQEADLEGRTRDRAVLRRLWEICQTPDFRKTTLDEHVRLCRTVFDHLTRGPERLPEDWIASQFASLDHTAGDIDVLAQRLAGVRTLAYAANRPDWLADPAHWQGRTRALEERLSDSLHERLMARFIDRRTSALVRGLHLREEVLAGVAQDGAVTVEGHYVGRLLGLQFDPAEGASELEDRALRAAARKAVAPEVARRLGALSAASDDAFTLTPDGVILWEGTAAGHLVAGGRPFAPKVLLLAQLGPEHARERARRRLEAFVAGEAMRVLAPMKRLEDALAGPELRGLARGIAYRLMEAGGVLARQVVAADVSALSQAERRALRSLGIRFSGFALFIAGLQTPAARALLTAFAAVEAPQWRASPERPSRLPDTGVLSSGVVERVLGWRRLVACGDQAVPVNILDRLEAVLTGAPRQAGGVVLDDDAIAATGMDKPQWTRLLKALGYTSARRIRADEPTVWRRRRDGAPPAVRSGGTGDARPPSTTPFAALAVLKPQAQPDRRRSARRRARKRSQAKSAG